MPTRRSPRKGSLQFWPRKRASKFLPSVNWKVIDSKKTIKGFICYKAGMSSAHVKDNTANSMTKNKEIVIPVTILECPPIKIFSVRLYKNGIVSKDVLIENLDKELKKKIKFPKKKTHKVGDIKVEDFDNITIIVYSIVKKSKLKKEPDLLEIGLTGTKEEKLHFIKEHVGKEISAINIYKTGDLIDLRGLTKGKGLVGPVKRFGIQLKQHKSEKGVRRPGSLGPWHPSRVTFRAPLAGQLGMFTRTTRNHKIIDIGNTEKKFTNIKNYGDTNSDYIVVSGSVQGTAKRQLVISSPLKETKKQIKKNYELVRIE